MSAPTPSVRLPPSGTKMGQGFQTLITLANSASAAFWEIEVTPPGVEGGDPIDTTTQHNVAWVTKSRPRLAEMTDSTARVAYDPAFIADAVNVINLPTTLTVTFPNGATLAAYGYLKSFIPGGMTRGAMPEATVTFVFTNQDPITCAEEGPVFTPGSGTCTG